MKGGYKKKQREKAAVIFYREKIRGKRREKLERCKAQQLSRLCVLRTARGTNSSAEDFKAGQSIFPGCGESRCRGSLPAPALAATGRHRGEKKRAGSKMPSATT